MECRHITGEEFKRFMDTEREGKNARHVRADPQARARLPPVWRRDDDDFDVLAEGEDQQ